jgi:hypothetical protein
VTPCVIDTITPPSAPVSALGEVEWYGSTVIDLASTMSLFENNCGGGTWTFDVVPTSATSSEPPPRVEFNGNAASANYGELTVSKCPDGAKDGDNPM